MADADYQRLGAACEQKALRGLFSCLHCGIEYKKNRRKRGEGEKFCTRECAFANKSANKAPDFCAYFAKYCMRCGEAGGRRRLDWTLCDPCKRQDALAVARHASRAWGEAKHKAAGRVDECGLCRAMYCPLYGFPGNKPYCSECVPLVKRQHKRIQRVARKALQRGATVENVNPESVFERAGWLCAICGISTPRGMRGTMEHNAPELDHIHPLSRGGAHSYANTQCLCRSCNAYKGAMTMGEVEAALSH